MKIFSTLIALLCVLTSSAQVHKGFSSQQLRTAQNKIVNTLGRYPKMFEPYKSQSERGVKLERVACSAGRVNLYFNEGVVQIAIREELCAQWEQAVRDALGGAYADCKVGLFYKNIPLERYIPNLYRSKITRDAKRSSTPIIGMPLVRPLEQMNYPKGLSYRHIALWASHGKVYNIDSARWEWQRPALFGSREDVNTFEYLDHYLIPMLEHAGAVVVSPRERDPQPFEVVVDNPPAQSPWRAMEAGYGAVDTLRDENPFEKGNYLIANGKCSMTYVVPVAQKDEYAVYVSYKALPNNSVATYVVENQGLTTSFEVNQAIGGGWVYLGKFLLDGMVKITVSGNGQITTDAVRIGGGMGNVMRGGQISGVPRWAEAARYYMQYNGVPATIYRQEHDTKAESDYMDDYKARGDWVSYVKQQQRVPIDMALALHTNAGIVDSIFGTLTINYTDKGRELYTNGKSKYASRDLADIVLTQVVDDIRATHCQTWTRRSMYDKSYAEVSRPDCPAVIVELLSHQNLNDIALGLDPAFRFTAARAIYKGILRFLADRYNVPYVVQPLPVNSFTAKIGGEKLLLSWQPTADKLEPTAVPTRYKLYTRLGQAAFDNGVNVDQNQIALPIIRDSQVRSYKITAINDGGESFDSPIVVAGFLPAATSPVVTLRDAQTHPCAPRIVAGGLDIASIVPQFHDRGIVGMQHDFDPLSPFVDNDNPGWGASDTCLEIKGLVGCNTDALLEKALQELKKGNSVISAQ